MEVWLLVSLAIAPVLATIIFIYWRDSYDREPWKLLLFSFLLGVVSAVPVLIHEKLLEYITFFRTNVFVKAFLGVGFVEEFWKLFFLLILPFRRKSFNEPLDGIVYAVMVSMGFATIENILYVLNGGLNVALLRSFTAVPAHAVFGVLMGYFVGVAKFKNKSKFLYILAGYLLASLFHGSYNFFLMSNLYDWMWIGAIVSLVVGIIFSVRALRAHRKLSRDTAMKKGKEGDVPFPGDAGQS